MSQGSIKGLGDDRYNFSVLFHIVRKGGFCRIVMMLEMEKIPGIRPAVKKGRIELYTKSFVSESS